MAEVSPSLSVIILNVNWLNSPIKRQRLEEWLQKQKQKYDPSICYLEEIHFRYKDTNKLKVKKIFHANINQQRAEVALQTN